MVQEMLHYSQKASENDSCWIKIVLQYRAGRTMRLKPMEQEKEKFW